MQTSMFFIFFLFFSFVASKRLPESNIIVKEGKFIIGGLFPAHANYNRTNGTCSEYNLQGLIYIQAMMYAIDKLANPILPNGNKLGYEIVDDCYSIDLAMEASVRFLMVNVPVPNPVVGVVGAANSDMSTAVASVLSVNSIPQISYSATSPELSDKTRYPSFLRTIPPDDAQVVAMADLIEYFNWTWVSVVATDDSYGRFALQGLKDILHKKKGMCLAAEVLMDASVTRQSVEAALDKLESSQRDYTQTR